MKTKILSVCLLLCLLLTACGQSNVPEAQNAYEDIFLKIDEANRPDTLLEKYSSVTYFTEEFFGDGSQNKVYAYQDSENYVYDESGDVYNYLFADHAGKAIGYWKDDNIYELNLYIGDGAYGEERLARPLTWFEYDPTEEISSVEEKDGVLLVESVYTSSEYVEDWEKAYRFAPGSIKEITVHYELDPANYEILKLACILARNDGATTLLSQSVRVSTSEEYVLPENFPSDTESMESRTIILIENPGTAEEVSHTYQVPLAFNAYCVFAKEYESELYADADFTIEVDYDTLNADKNDFVGYIRKAE